MITGSPAKSLIAFAIPMILGNLFQQFYSLADSIIVGRTLGQNALAAVGSTAAVVLVYVAIANGLAIGCSVVISQLFGAKDYTKMKTAFNTSFMTFVGLSILFLAIGLSTCTAIIRLTGIPQEIVADAKSYYYIYAAGFPGLFFYNVSNSGYNALGKSRMPLLFLLISSVLNIGLDLLFILKFHWGVAGAAFATTISQYLAATVSFVTLLIYIRKNFRTEEKPALFSVILLKSIAKVGIPSMVTSSIVSVGFVAMQSLINSFGTDVMAAYTAAVRIDGIAIVPIVQIGNATSTFTAQNIGAGQVERVPKGYHVSLLMNAVICAAVGVLLFFLGGAFVGLFLDAKTSAAAIQIGSEYLRIVGSFYFLMGAMNASTGVLRGAGDATWAMIAILCNFAARVAYSYIMVAVTGDYHMIWWSNIIGWSVGLIIGYARYRSGKWKTKSLVAKVAE